jgi:uncharacterized protein YjbI with pentapeptide repeats
MLSTGLYCRFASTIGRSYRVLRRGGSGGHHVTAAVMYIHPANFFEDRSYQIDPNSCFVLMPFSEAWSTRIFRIIREVVEPIGYTCRRADDYYGRVVLEDLWRRINEAAFIIADLTAHNPNVYYELGIAHALGKEIIPILQSHSQIPFDQQPFRVLFYEDNADGYEVLRDRLPQWIRALEYGSSPQVIIKKQQVDRFNEWRRDRQHIDLSYSDFSDLTLRGIDLTDAYLRAAILRGTDLSSAALSNAKLTGADLRNAILDHATLRRTHLSEANLTGASIRETDFVEALLIRADLTDAHGSGANFVGSNLSEATLVGADLSDADLRNGVWLRVKLDGTSLRGAQVAGITVERATWNRYHATFEQGEGVEEIIIEHD